MAVIDRIPVEVAAAILERLASPDDLVSSVRASAALLRGLQATRHATLRTIIKRAFGCDLRAAVAIVKAPDYRDKDMYRILSRDETVGRAHNLGFFWTPWVTTALDHWERYLEDKSSFVSFSNDETVRLYQLYHKVSRHIGHHKSSFLRPKAVKVTRRGLLLFELFSRLFTKPWYSFVLFSPNESERVAAAATIFPPTGAIMDLEPDELSFHLPSQWYHQLEQLSARSIIEVVNAIQYVEACYIGYSKELNQQLEQMITKVKARRLWKPRPTQEQDIIAAENHRKDKERNIAGWILARDSGLSAATRMGLSFFTKVSKASPDERRDLLVKALTALNQNMLSREEYMSDATTFKIIRYLPTDLFTHIVREKAVWAARYKAPRLKGRRRVIGNMGQPELNEILRQRYEGYGILQKFGVPILEDEEGAVCPMRREIMTELLDI